jgi:hypothetical protein
MRLPIDTAALNFTCSLPPEPVIDFTSRQQKADANGEPLNSVELVAFTDDGAQVFSVKFAGPLPAGMKQGTPVRVTGLVVSDWAMNDRHGLSFRATKVEAAHGQKAGAA